MGPPTQGGPDVGGMANVQGSQQPWYCMENPTTGDRIMARSREEVSILQDTGYALRRLYRNQEEADAWALGTDIRLMARKCGEQEP